MNIFGVHLDPGATLPRARRAVADIEALGHRALFFNTNSADACSRACVLNQIEQTLTADGVHFLLHSLAFGSLLPCITDDPEGAISEAQMAMTLRVMAHSLVYWVQDMVRRDLPVRGSRV